jgi:hypothetical protein
MVNRLAKGVAVPPPLLWPLLGLLIPGLGSAALPPPMDESGLAGAPATANPGPGAGAPMAVGPTPFERMLSMLPRTSFGGSVSYNTRRDISNGSRSTQSGLETMLVGKGVGFIWQPWLARYSGSANARISQAKSETNGDSNAAKSDSNAAKSVSLTGALQLSLLPLTDYPFEAHYSRAESRSTNDLATEQRYAGQSYGFSQRYSAATYQLNGGWDRSTQNQGRDRQDVLNLTGSHSDELQQLLVAANANRGVHQDLGEGTSGSSQQTNFSVLHGIAPSDAIRFDNIASVTQSDYRVRQNIGSSRVSQLSSVAFWRPDEIEQLTVVGGARLLAQQTSASSLDRLSDVPQSDIGSNNVNFNVGAGYEVSQALHLNGSANVNQVNAGGERSLSAAQSVGGSYQPEPLELGKFHYSWLSAANASRSSGIGATREATLQLGHNLSRNTMLDSGDNIGFGVGQSLSLAARTVVRAERNAANNFNNSSGVGAVNADGVRKQLSHTASTSWSKQGEAASMAAQLSATDSRTIGDSGEFFQSINFQTTSSMPTSSTSSLVGNLTIQAVRQSQVASQGAPAPRVLTNTYSSGSLSYHQQRLFGVRGMRLQSDLRLNSQALLPLFGGPQDEEMAAWDSRIDYVIGRTQFRLTFLMARTATPATRVGQNGPDAGTRVASIYKSIAFAVSRSIGGL